MYSSNSLSLPPPPISLSLSVSLSFSLSLSPFPLPPSPSLSRPIPLFYIIAHASVTTVYLIPILQGGDMQLVFELDSMKSSKELWSTSRGYAEFYTEPRRRLQEEPDPQSEFYKIPF